MDTFCLICGSEYPTHTDTAHYPTWSDEPSEELQIMQRLAAGLSPFPS